MRKREKSVREAMKNSIDLVVFFSRNGEGGGSSRRRRRRRFQGWSDEKDEKTAAGDFWCLPLKPSFRLIPCDESEGVRIDGSSPLSLSILPSPPSAASTTTRFPLSSSCVDGRGDSLTRSSRLLQPPQLSHQYHGSQGVSSSSCSSPKDADAEMTRGSSPRTPHQAPSPQRQLPGDSCSFSDDHSTRGDFQGRSQLGRSEDEEGEEDHETEDENSNDGVNTVLYRQRKYRVSAGERKSTLLLGRMKLRDIASYLKGHLSQKRGEGRSGENQKSKENEDQANDGERGGREGDEDLDFIRMVSDLGLTLTVGDCATLRIVQVPSTPRGAGQTFHVL